MLPRLRGASSPLVLLLALALLLPPAPIAAQGADVDQWRNGDPGVSDDFSRNSGLWTLDTGRSAPRSVSRGRLLVKVPEEELFRWVTLNTGDVYKDFYAEADAERVSGPEDGMMGIVFRYADQDNFYMFLTSADGYYALMAYVDGELDRIIDWAETGALDTGEDAQNRLGVMAVGRELVIFANGEELERVQDRSFSEGQIALLAGTNQDGGLEVAYDNFGLWTGATAPAAGRRSIRRSTPEVPTRPAGTPDAVVASETLNVRAGPGTNYPVIGTLKRGDQVVIAGRSPDSKWARLAFSDASEAWASAQYLTINVDFPSVAVATPPPAPAAPPKQPAAPKQNVAWLIIENHIDRYITVQVNDYNFRVEGKVGDKPGRYRFELQGAGRYRVAAQLPNGGGHNWDLYVEPTADKCANRQGCIALGQTFMQTYY